MTNIKNKECQIWLCYFLSEYEQEDSNFSIVPGFSVIRAYPYPYIWGFSNMQTNVGFELGQNASHSPHYTSENDYWQNCRWELGLLGPKCDVSYGYRLFSIAILIPLFRIKICRR